LLQILIHFELGNYRLLSSLIANTKYQLRKNEQLFGCENLILSFFGRISKNKDDNSGANLQYQEFITNLKKLKQDTFEKKIFEIFDFEYWASKKLDMLLND
jgi:hypothetical protein